MKVIIQFHFWRISRGIENFLKIVGLIGGGGEPTLNPFFEDCVNWIEKQGYFQRINTNAIEYSKATEAALKEGNASLRVSIDAGTKECFHRMGHEHYETVWDNIKQYRKVSDKI